MNSFASDMKRDKIKVLIIAPALPLVGGQTVQASRLVENFRSDPDIQMAQQPVNPSFFPRLQKIKYVRTVLTQTKYIFDLIVKIPKYDVIHTYSASYFSFLLAPTPAILIAKLFGKKVILNYKSGEAEDHLRRWPKTTAPIIRLCDKIVTPSGYLVDVFAKFGFSAEPVFNIADTNRYRSRKRVPLRPAFLSNRNFEPLYNVACTLRAFGIVQKKFPDAVLMIAGEGSEKRRLKKLAKQLKLKNVEFKGRVSPAAMPELYDKADIYLNTPNIDNMPSSVIEAYAAGTPVVSTNAGGIPYILEHEKSGLLVDVDDHSELANQVIRLLQDNDLAQEIISNGLVLSKKYSWENVRKDWVRIYRELVGKGNGK